MTKAKKFVRCGIWGFRCAFVLILATGVFLSSAQTQKSPITVPSDTSSGTYGGTLPISSGDMVQVDVFGSPELSKRYRVSQSGDVDLVLAGRLHISSLSAGEAAALIEDLYRDKQIVLSPHVNVFVSEYASQGVTILGEVKSPGIYPALGEHRLYDLIAAAGGFTTSASTRVTILHPNGGSEQSVELSNTALIDQANDVPLQPGDRVIVSSAGIVYVLGDVGKPTGLLLSRTDNHLSVLKALSLAGGFNRTAKTGSATIISQSGNGLVHKDFDLKKILEHKDPDPELAAGDVLYVPNSAAKTIGYRGLEAAFAAATNATVFITAR